jgi:hypothetical protein
MSGLVWRGQRVKSTVLFVGGHFEFNDMTDQVTKYYFAGMNRIATPALAPGASVRKYTIPQSMSVEYLLGDHPSPPLKTSLGSTIMRFISQSALVFGN